MTWERWAAMREFRSQLAERERRKESDRRIAEMVQIQRGYQDSLNRELNERAIAREDMADIFRTFGGPQP